MKIIFDIAEYFCSGVEYTNALSRSVIESKENIFEFDIKILPSHPPVMRQQIFYDKVLMIKHIKGLCSTLQRMPNDLMNDAIFYNC